MTKQGNDYVQFTHESKFDVSKFDEYSFDSAYNGPIFSTNHNGVGYTWRILIKPNGGRYRRELDNGEWLHSQEDRNNVRYGLEFLGGPLSSVSVDYSLKVKPRDQSAATVHHEVFTGLLFNNDCNRWVEKIATKQELDKDGSFADGVFRVVVEIKMSFDLFDPDKVLQKLKEQISWEQENITVVQSFFFDSVETEPACGICLKLVCGPQKKVFFTNPQVLEKNSEYFRNLLNSSGDFKEKEESKIEFRDKAPEGVYAALKYIYLKELPQNFKEVAKLCLPAAHLFLLPGLVLECERVLIEDLSAENDVDMAVLAETFEMPLLKNMALNSIALHYDDVMENPRLVKKLNTKQLCSELLKLVTYHSRSAASGISVQY